MSGELNSGLIPELQSTRLYRTGAASGFVATVAMGLVISAGDIEVLRVAIGGIYGFSGSLVAGWLAHGVHGTVFGVIFAAVLSDPGLHGLSDQRWKTTVAGIVYGLVLAFAGAGIIMPIWLDVLGIMLVDSIPYVTAATVTWHLVYGAVLGALVSTIETR